MKYYEIIFTNGSETIGKQKNKTEMRKDANLYCKQWHLTERVQAINEISEAEFISRLR